MVANSSMSNPVINSLQTNRWGSGTSEVATFRGIMDKAAIALLSTIIIAGLTYSMTPHDLLGPAVIFGSIASLVVVVAVCMKRSIGALGTLFYAVIEGIMVGALSKILDNRYEGLASQALVATFVVTAITLTVYRVFNIRTGAKFRKVVTIGTLSLAGLYLVNFVAALLGFNMKIMEWGGDAGMISMGVSAIAIVLAVLNLVRDFETIREIVEHRSPATMEWAAAFGLVVTLIWLYTELLRVLSYFRD